ncbi:TPA: hypothetical protein ACLNTW_003788, partial [Vibrio cholerae O1]
TVKSAGAAISDAALLTTNGADTEPVRLRKLNVGPILVETGPRKAAIGPVDLAFVLNLVLHKNGDLNLATLFAPTQTDAPAKAAANSAPWSASVEKLTISDSALNFTDETLATPT